MATNQPFIRQIELLVGPLTEQEGGGPVNQGILLRSDGGRNDIAIDFRVRKTLNSAANETSVNIYNLREDIRNRIRVNSSRLKLSVGYANVGLSTLSTGAILYAETDDTGVDFTTSLEARDGLGSQSISVTNRSFVGGTNIASVVASVAGDLVGVATGRIDVDGILGMGGLSVSDSTASALDGLGRQYGYSWSIQDGEFQALSDQRPFARQLVLNVENRNLIKAVPKVWGVQTVTSGLDIDAILDPFVRPGDRVQLTTRGNQRLDGLYKIHTVEFIGGTYTQNWTMKLEVFKSGSPRNF